MSFDRVIQQSTDQYTNLLFVERLKKNFNDPHPHPPSALKSSKTELALIYLHEFPLVCCLPNGFTDS